MANSLEMFGTGGEGLGGLFLGNQVAQQQAQADATREQTLQEIANSQAMQRQRELGNQYEEAIMPEKIAAYKTAYADKQEQSAMDRFNRTGEQFGKFGSVLASLPAAARPAALKTMASQSGVGDDNPLLQHLMSVDPNELPDTMQKFSQRFYEQGNAALAENLKRDAMYRQAEMQAQERAAAQADSNATKLMIAQMMADSRRDAAGIAAAARAGKGDNGKPLKETYDNFLTRTAREKVESGEWTWDQANEYVQRAKLQQGAVRVPDTGPAVMSGGTPTTAQQRVESAVQQSAPTGAKPAQQKFEEGKTYRDANGNMARYRNGKWEPIGGSGVPK